jgi:hypothetical protein
MRFSQEPRAVESESPVGFEQILGDGDTIEQRRACEVDGEKK